MFASFASITVRSNRYLERCSEGSFTDQNSIQDNGIAFRFSKKCLQPNAKNHSKDMKNSINLLNCISRLVFTQLIMYSYLKPKSERLFATIQMRNIQSFTIFRHILLSLVYYSIEYIFDSHSDSDLFCLFYFCLFCAYSQKYSVFIIFLLFSNKTYSVLSVNHNIRKLFFGIDL